MSKRSKDLPPAITPTPLLSHNSIFSLHQTPSPSPIVTMSSIASDRTEDLPDYLRYEDAFANRLDHPDCLFGKARIDPAGPIASGVSLSIPEDFKLPTPGACPRDWHRNLAYLRAEHLRYADNLTSHQPLKEREAKDMIQRVRSRYCLLLEWMIQQDFRDASASALIIALGSSLQKPLRFGRHRHQTLPVEINKSIASYFLPPISQYGRVSDLTAWLDYYTYTLGYSGVDTRLITTLLCEDTARRQMRRDNRLIIYTKSGGAHLISQSDAYDWRPSSEDDLLALPWGFQDNSSPTELCDCGECYSCIADMLPELAPKATLALVNDI